MSKMIMIAVSLSLTSATVSLFNAALGQSLPLSPSETQDIVQPSSTTLNVNSMNSTIASGQSGHSSIQPAVAAAGTTGSVIIPQSYPRTDFVTSNSNGTQVDGQRPSSVSSPVRFIDARSFGAICNGTNDDTAAIKAAVAASYAYNIDVGGNVPAVVVQLPAGTCRITSTIVFGPYGGLTGQGNATTVIGDFTDKTTWGSTDVLIQISITGSFSQEAISPRRFWGFRIRAGGKQLNQVQAIGFQVLNTSNDPSSSSYAVPYLSIDHIQINTMDTGIDAQDMVSSVIDDVGVSQVRVGIALNGDVANVQIHNCNIGYSTDSNTSSTKGSKGILIEPNSKYIGGTAYPQGIDIASDTIVGFDEDLDLSQGIAVSIHDSVFDYGQQGPAGNGRATVVFEQAGAGLFFCDNYVATTTARGSGIYSIAIGAEGLWITDNWITDYVTPNSSAIGIILGAGSGSGNIINGVHINGNSINNFYQGIGLSQDVQYSEIAGNTGANIEGEMINLSKIVGLTHTGLYIDRNLDKDSVDIITNAGNASGFTLEQNQSASTAAGQASLYVGTLITSTSSDTMMISLIPVGAHCSVEAQNATAAAMTGVYVPPVVTAGSVVVNHSGTTGGEFSVFCSFG